MPCAVFDFPRHVVDHALPQRRDLLGHKILLSVGLHGRAILANRMTASDERFPTTAHQQGRKKVIFRHLGNGSVEPYSLLANVIGLLKT